MESQTLSVVLAAGTSTRMKSKTSKLLHPILGRSLIQLAVEQAGLISSRAVFVVGHQREEIEKAVRKAAPEHLKIDFVLQEKQLGTADAVRTALGALSDLSNDDDIFIMGADSGFLHRESLLKFQTDHQSLKAVVSLMTAVAQSYTAYGRILRNAQNQIERIVEVKEATEAELAVREVNTGFYLTKLFALREGLSKISNQNKAKEFYFTDLVALARQRGWLLHSQTISEEEAAGVNTQADLAAMTATARDRINEKWMSLGVRMQDPSSTFIDMDVTCESDVVLEAGVHLRGKTRISAGATIGAYSILQNASVAENARIESHSHLFDCSIGANSSVGPFARIRGGSVLDRDVKIGNFVEIKKSRLAAGVKSGHLAYLGDAMIGEETNIGAGTITCNYDGFEKHPTMIGKRVFIGSNSSLVAPVEIGDDAIVGAGSVITKNIASESLAVERSEQRELKDGAKKFRAKRKNLR